MGTTTDGLFVLSDGSGLSFEISDESLDFGGTTLVLESEGEILLDLVGVILLDGFP